MFGIVAIIVCVITLILLKIFLNIRFKDIKNIKLINSNDLEEISNKFQNDQQICKDILKKLNNEAVKIKVEPEYNSCLYIIFNNTITIGKFQQNYMKLQTIAHECVHSCQDKRVLWSNFIFTNIYLIYFSIILILEIFNSLPYSYLHIFILLFLSLVQYIIRNNLENEAMIKARYIAKEYIEENKILEKSEEEALLKEYDRVNEIGIPFMSYYLICVNIIKIIIFSFVVLI